MKHEIILANEPMTEYERLFIMYWKNRKGYQDHKTMSLTECIEFLTAYGFDMHSDISLFDELQGGSYFNHVLIVGELVIAYDGEEMIDTAFYYVLQAIKKRLAMSQQFPKEEN